MDVRPLLVFLFLILPLVGNETNASKWFYRAWQTDDGLPDNSVSTILQSPEGYLWIGTNAGVIRFNGYDFSPLPLNQIDNLPSKQVHAMTLDQSGQIWLGMERGPIVRIEKNSYRTFGKPDGIERKRITNFAEDPKGRLWAALSNKVYLIENDKVTALGSKHHVRQARIATSLACDTNGQIWLTSDSILGRIDEKGFTQIKDFTGPIIKIATARNGGLWIAHASKLFHFKSPNQQTPVVDLPLNCEVTSLLEDRRGAIWIATRKHGLLTVIQNKLEHAPSSHPWVTCLFEDDENNIWAGTKGGGLNLILPRIANLTDSTNGLPFSSVRSTCCDSSGAIWATSLNGRLAFKKPHQTWRLFEGLPEGFKPNCVTSDSQGQIWLGSREHGLLQIEDDRIVSPAIGSNLLSGSFVRSIFPAKNGDLWLATSHPEQLHRLRDKQLTTIESSINFRAIRAMTETPDGTIWLGSSDGHLFRVEDLELIDESTIDGPTLHSIRTLHSTPDGSLWIGYAGDGLGHLNNGVYRRFTTEDGLYDNYLSQIQHDENECLWIGSNRGMFRVQLEHLLSNSGYLYCQVYGRDNGLPGIQPSRDYVPSSGRDQNGNLFFGTHSGLLEVTPANQNHTSPAPRVILEKITQDNTPIALLKTRSMITSEIDALTTDLSEPNPSIKLSPDHDNLVISFAALNFDSPQNTLIRYRLHPIDKHWQEVENKRRVTFPRLPAGDYTFQVIASNSSGVWNSTGASIDISVQPFFWETWWFKLGAGSLTALAAGGLVYLSQKRKHRDQLQSLAATQALEQERSRIARDIHDDLGASLTRIALLSQSSSSEDEKTQSAISQISSTTRELMRSMDGVVWAISPEHDHFDDLANYLSSYAQEFLSVADIRCRLFFPVDLPERHLSAQLRHNLLLAFKEALNNIVKYAHASEVRITMEPDDHFFSLRIEDNGDGIDPNAPPDPNRPNAGNGMANMEERMKEIGGSCTFQSSLNQGTTVEFQIPFIAKA